VSDDIRNVTAKNIALNNIQPNSGARLTADVVDSACPAMGRTAIWQTAEDGFANLAWLIAERAIVDNMIEK
jgi:hypothetical protein